MKFLDLVEDAINKLEAQGELAIEDDSPRCWYHLIKKGKELRCIVGHMMPEEVAQVADGEIQTLKYSYEPLAAQWAKQFSESEIDFLQELQSIHDLNDHLTISEIIGLMREALNREKLYGTTRRAE